MKCFSLNECKKSQKSVEKERQKIIITIALIVCFFAIIFSFACKNAMEWDGVYIETSDDEYLLVEETKLTSGHFQTGGKNGRFFILDAGYNAPKKYYAENPQIMEVDDARSFYFKGTYFNSETIKLLTLHHGIRVQLDINNSLWHPDGLLKDSGVVYMISEKKFPFMLKEVEQHKYNVVTKKELDSNEIFVFWIADKVWFFKIKENKSIPKSPASNKSYRDDKAEVKAIMQSKISISQKIEKLKKMANSGSSKASLSLGLIYQLGIGGIAKDGQKALKWYLIAVEGGDGEAQYLLGNYYAGGIDGEVDLEKAVMWYKKAAEKGVKDAAEALKKLEQNIWLNKTGWISIEDVCKSGQLDCSKPYIVTQNSFITHWAGEVFELYYVKGEKTFRRLKIRVTWITDKSPYRCGQTIVKNVSEIKDFTARSIAMKPCK